MKMVFAEKVAYIRIKAFPILQYKIDTPVLTRATEVIDPTRQQLHLRGHCLKIERTHRNN